jgi:hypothetical protein
MKTLLLIALAPLTCAANAQQDRQISIHLYNLSGIPAHTLDQAIREVSRIFVQQDVTLNWTAGAPEAEEGDTTDRDGPTAFGDADVRPFLVVRVGRGLAFKVPNGVLGVSRPHAQFGISATIFQERIEGLCQEAGRDFAVLLGHAIAHEIGHVALASDAHSLTGIMRARWGKDDFDLAAMGRLGFDPRQGAVIRAYASRVASPVRLKTEAASAMVPGRLETWEAWDRASSGSR